MASEKWDDIVNLAEPWLNLGPEKFYDWLFRNPLGIWAKAQFAKGPMYGEVVMGIISFLVQKMIKKWNPPAGLQRTASEMIEDFPREIRRRLSMPVADVEKTDTERGDATADDLAEAIFSIVAPKNTPKADIESETSRLQGLAITWLESLTEQQNKFIMGSKKTLTAIMKPGRDHDALLGFMMRQQKPADKKDEHPSRDPFYEERQEINRERKGIQNRR